MSRRLRTPLAKLLDLVEREVVAGQVKQRVKKHGSVAVGEDEAVASGPMRIARVIPQVAVPEYKTKRRQAHRSARMSAVGLLHRVHRKRADGVDAERIEFLLFR